MTTGTEKENRNNRFALDIAVLAVMILAVLVSFWFFTRNNRDRVQDLTGNFVEASTTQTAERLNDIVNTARRNVDLLALLYSAGDQREVDAAMLRDFTDRSTFDYVEFIRSDGMDLTADGQTADLSDRAHFKDAMNGGSGKTVIHNSRITGETLLIFYAPAWYDGEITGVFCGMLRGDILRERLTMDYFGLQSTIYLVDREGSLILSTGSSVAPGSNLPDALEKRGTLSKRDTETLRAALDDSNSIDNSRFNFNGSSGDGSAYVTVLEDGDWALMQLFPSAVNQTMTKSANAAGIQLEAELAAVFVAYLLYIILKDQRQKRRLVTEKQEMSGIVTGVTQLFSRFALVDYEANTYEYLDDSCGGHPREGAYTDLMASMETRYVPEGPEEEPIAHKLSREAVQASLTEDVPYLQYEYEIDLEGRRWENISILCVKRHNGVPVTVLYAIQDVTALKEREAEIRLALKNASEAAEAANHAKSDFLARMSHDIRTPMNAIMGMTAVAAMHMDDRERLTDCLNKITVSSRHLLALINDVLDMSKIESGKVTLTEEPFGIADLVDSVVTIMRAQVNSKHQQLDVRISDIRHEDVIGDTLRLRQVFVNILGNAVKFTPVEGRITFSIRELPSPVRGMGSFEFVCQDTGIGMTEEFMKTVFDPFSRSDQADNRKIEGTGLGMSISRNIVRMMDGDIQVQSELGRGSTFTVQLYLKLQDLEAEDVRGLTDLRVLVADDDESSCVTTCETLEDIGMRAQWVLSGDDAVRCTLEAHEAKEDFAAVILDWKMPGKDGVETAREIRKKVGDQVPIIILSAYDWSDIEAEAREAGVQAFIGKPLFRSRLIYALKSVLAPGAQSQSLSSGELEATDYAGRRVLLVEDNELNREIAVELLSMTGIQVEQAEDGSQALALVADRPEGTYDLIFMDIQMPIMDGYEATRRIRALDRRRHIPIVAMTANAFADDIRKAREAGMDAHISKPVELDKLLETLGKWL